MVHLTWDFVLIEIFITLYKVLLISVYTSNEYIVFSENNENNSSKTFS